MTELGELLGSGRAAEVFALGEGQVIKLLREGGSPLALEREAAAQRAAHAAGLPVPAVVSIETMEGRAGLVMSRVEGLDGLTAVDRKPWRVWAIGRQVGRLHQQLGSANAPPELPRLLETLRLDIAQSPHIPSRARDRLLAAFDALPDGNTVCHLDFHPGNLVESPEGPFVIDFADARAGHPLADHAKSLVILEAGSLPPGASRWELALVKVGRRLMRAAYIAGYRSDTAIDEAALRRWRAMMIAHRLTQGIEVERVRLLRMLSKSMREAGI